MSDCYWIVADVSLFHFRCWLQRYSSVTLETTEVKLELWCHRLTFSCWSGKTNLINDTSSGDFSSKCCIQVNYACIQGCRKYSCVPVIWPVGQSLSWELCHYSPKQLQELSVNDIITPVCLSAHMLVIGLRIFRRRHSQKETLCVVNYLWAHCQVVKKLNTNYLR